MLRIWCTYQSILHTLEIGMQNYLHAIQFSFLRSALSYICAEEQGNQTNIHAQICSYIKTCYMINISKHMINKSQFYTVTNCENDIFRNTHKQLFIDKFKPICRLPYKHRRLQHIFYCLQNSPSGGIHLAVKQQSIADYRTFFVVYVHVYDINIKKT